MKQQIPVVLQEDVVIQVLLADGWHDVAQLTEEVGSAFTIGTFTLVDTDGAEPRIDDGPLWFEFQEDGGIGGSGWISGPITALIAVRTA